MDEAKGWRILFEVAERLLNEGHDLQVNFHGAPTKSWCKEVIYDYFNKGKYPNQIRYRGFSEGENKRQAFREAEIFCFPSFNEAFPLSVLEAMSWRLPIVATNVGAVKDALKEGKGGYLVEPRNPEALHSALSKLIHSREMRTEMGKFNRNRYESFYKKGNYIDRWTEFLLEHNRR